MTKYFDKEELRTWQNILKEIHSRIICTSKVATKPTLIALNILLKETQELLDKHNEEEKTSDPKKLS